MHLKSHLRPHTRRTMVLPMEPLKRPPRALYGYSDICWIWLPTARHQTPKKQPPRAGAYNVHSGREYPALLYLPIRPHPVKIWGLAYLGYLIHALF